MKTRFWLLTLLLVTMIVAFAIGWYSERVRRLAIRQQLESEMATRIRGNINIQAAWSTYEIAAAYAEEPDRIQDTLDSKLVSGVYWLWRFRKDVDAAFAQRSPGKTALSLAGTLIRALDCKTPKDYYEKASRIPFDANAKQVIPGSPQDIVLDTLHLSEYEKQDLSSFISEALKIDHSIMDTIENRDRD